MNPLFLELTGILVVAGLIAYLLHFFKQPSIVAYLITGLLIGPLALYKLQHAEILHGLADIGITLLLFMVGLELDISQLKKIGKSAVIAGISQILVTTGLGFGLATLLGFAWLPSLYLALAMTFSSTIIAVKLLSEKKDMHRLYGKLTIGIFLVQDIAAIIILILLGGTSESSGMNILGSGLTGVIIFTISKAFMIGVVVVLLSRYVLPKLVQSVLKNDEMVLLFSLGWALGLASVFSAPFIGFNAAIGGFVAGLALANSGGHFQISGRIKSLRDFFIIIFFIVLGSQLVINNFQSAIIPAIIITGFVLIGKPIIVAIILGLLRYKARTGILSGITIGQVSEFSLIILALGLSAGHIDNRTVTVVTMVGIASIAISSYAIIYSHVIYKKFLAKFVNKIEAKRGQTISELDEQQLENHIIIIGAHRLGTHITKWLQSKKENFVVLDINPAIVNYYTNQGIPAICDDISDPFIQDVLNIQSAKMIISTAPDYHDTLVLLNALKGSHRRIKTIVTAADEQDAITFYKNGASYVLLPHFIGGVHLAEVVENSIETGNLRIIREQHIKTLKHALKKVGTKQF